MTIRISIKNEDSGENRVILVRQLNADGSEIPGISGKKLKGGESTENYVHSTNQILVTEVNE